MKSIKRLEKRRNNKTKKHIPKQKELLNLFNDLSDTILIDKNIRIRKSKRQKKNKKKNKNGETLMSSNEDNENQNEDDDETMSQTKKVKDLNHTLDEIIDNQNHLNRRSNRLKN